MKLSMSLSALLLGTLVLFSGCSKDNMKNSPQKYTYSVELTNITAGQAMSPVLVTSNTIFTVGKKASLGLEKLAEGGDNSTLLDANGISGSGLLKPGKSETITFTSTSTKISLASMLVYTNDAFVGLNEVDIAFLNVGDSTNLYGLVYDAGTEENTETNTTVPDLGGEGINSARESRDTVTLHSGVLSNEDGLSTSGLSAQFKFASQALYVNITRTK